MGLEKIWLFNIKSTPFFVERELILTSQTIPLFIDFKSDNSKRSRRVWARLCPTMSSLLRTKNLYAPDSSFVSAIYSLLGLNNTSVEIILSTSKPSVVSISKWTYFFTLASTPRLWIHFSTDAASLSAIIVEIRSSLPFDGFLNFWISIFFDLKFKAL